MAVAAFSVLLHGVQWGKCFDHHLCLGGKYKNPYPRQRSRRSCLPNLTPGIIFYFISFLFRFYHISGIPPTPKPRPWQAAFKDRQRRTYYTNQWTQFGYDDSLHVLTGPAGAGCQLETDQPIILCFVKFRSISCTVLLKGYCSWTFYWLGFATTQQTLRIREVLLGWGR